MYEVKITHDAMEDLERLKKLQRQAALRGIELQLAYEPTLETRNRKRLRPNTLANWELRVGNLRVFYNVEKDAALVWIVAVGVKVGSQLYIRNEEFGL